MACSGAKTDCLIIPRGKWAGWCLHNVPDEGLVEFWDKARNCYHAACQELRRRAAVRYAKPMAREQRMPPRRQDAPPRPVPAYKVG
jgi:hypothetical protein